MDATSPPTTGHRGGIALHAGSQRQAAREQQQFRSQLSSLQLEVGVLTNGGREPSTVQFSLEDGAARAWGPAHDTLGLCATLGLDTETSTHDLEREIVAAMLLSPEPLVFPSHEELASAIRIRRNIVLAARKTALAFDTTCAAERPEDFWRYDEDHGFLLQPGRSLIDALIKATQPDVSGKLYSFSCYRATEYVILLGMAQELRESNPALLAELQRRSEQDAIRSGRFHDVFLYEYGSMAQPLPPRYYVPGDRLWFRNPDEASSDVTGYEGSWVLYLGNGLFSNFWKRDQPFSFDSKCVELYHWRHGTYRDAQGTLQMDESIVEQRVAQTLSDPAETQQVLHRMARLRDPKGVYAEGGCIDTTRESPRWVRPGTATVVLPPL